MKKAAKEIHRPAEQTVPMPPQIERLRQENLKLRRVLMEQPDYSPLIIQLGEALKSGIEEKQTSALAAYHAWQEGAI